MSMKRYCAAAVSLFGLWIVAVGGARAQQMPGRSGAVGKVQLDVSVTTTKGQPAGELSEKDFAVLDNKSPRSIASITRVEGKDAPVEVVIVVDSVNTPYTYLGFQRDQIAKYLRSNGGVLPYRTTFAVLTDTSFGLYNGASKDGNDLANKLEHTNIGLREITRSQGFWGAADRMTVSLNALRSSTAAEEKKPGRKLVLWVSPGWPLLSGPGVELDSNQEEDVYRSAIAFSRELRQADMTLYSINSWGATESVNRELFYRSFLNGLKGPGEAEWGNVSLQVLAAQSGGLVLSSNSVIGMMKQCVADANEYYRIVLDAAPDERPDTYHRIDVKLAAKGLEARTRTGYYSQP
ncbi:MAG TPA: VWA domain-containing protein [Acidobacteriaceae bacterium]